MEKVYVTKYALTDGIQEFDAIEFSENYVKVSAPKYPNKWTLFFGFDWHRTMDGAKARADHVRKAKIKSLKKQIERLEAMSF